MTSSALSLPVDVPWKRLGEDIYATSTRSASGGQKARQDAVNEGNRIAREKCERISQSRAKRGERGL
jgi:hypothetical protein